MADNNWLETLQTPSPQTGFDLAIELSKKGVKYKQLNMKIAKAHQKEMVSDVDELMAVSQIIALNFQTIAKANNYWKT